MKAAVYTRYGPPEVLHVVEVEKPTPKANEVLIKVHATTASVGDSRMRSFSVPLAMWVPARLYLGIRKPRRAILGMELSGVVESVGAEVKRFQPGDAVMASTFDDNFGGYAAYKCLPQDSLIVMKPETLSFEAAAAAIGGGLTALRCLQKADIQPNHHVLIYGASGAVGTTAVQLAKHHYDAHVTGVCSTANLDLVRSIGADDVIDYKNEDFVKRGPVYDVVFDAVAKYPKARAKLALKPGGTYLNVHRDSDSSGRKLGNQELAHLRDLLAAGTLKPVIDRVYPLDEIVEAHRYVDTGRKRGNVVITLT